MIVALIFLAFIGLPVLLVSLDNLQYSINYGRLPKSHVKVGDTIVYRKQKASTHPGVRALDIYPAAHGDLYSYFVKKYWTVEDVRPDGLIVAKTRTNKQHHLRPEDPNLRKAGFIERLRFGNRFPQLTGSLT